MTFNAMSRIGCRPSDAYLREFEAAVLTALPHFKTQESAMTINAFTKMVDYAPSPAFFEGVERCVVQKVRLHRAQEVANTIHGLGRLGYNPSRQVRRGVCAARHGGDGQDEDTGAGEPHQRCVRVADGVRAGVRACFACDV